MYLGKYKYINKHGAGEDPTSVFRLARACSRRLHGRRIARKFVRRSDDEAAEDRKCFTVLLRASEVTISAENAGDRPPTSRSRALAAVAQPTLAVPHPPRGGGRRSCCNSGAFAPPEPGARAHQGQRAAAEVEAQGAQVLEH